MSPLRQNNQITIPLVRPDLSQEDQSRFILQLKQNPFVDEKLLQRWEGGWQNLWQRPAVAYADPNTLLLNLKTHLRLSSETAVNCSPLLHPSWREAMTTAWLGAAPQNILTDGGQENWSACRLGYQFLQHNFGLIATTAPKQQILLEDISAIMAPLPNCGVGDVQLLLLDGNRMLQGGASCVALSTDRQLIAALTKSRPAPPTAALCALGISQLQRLDDLLRRRGQLADTYLKIRHRNLFKLPPNPKGGRRWEAFIIELPSKEQCQALQQFLNRAGIGAAPPIWYNIRSTKLTPITPPLEKLLHNSLALPLYASLTDQEQKKIINRIHRWVERGGPI